MMHLVIVTHSSFLNNTPVPKETFRKLPPNIAFFLCAAHTEFSKSYLLSTGRRLFSGARKTHLLL